MYTKLPRPNPLTVEDSLPAYQRPATTVPPRSLHFPESFVLRCACMCCTASEHMSPCLVVSVGPIYVRVGSQQRPRPPSRLSRRPEQTGSIGIHYWDTLQELLLDFPDSLEHSTNILWHNTESVTESVTLVVRTLYRAQTSDNRDNCRQPQG